MTYTYPLYMEYRYDTDPYRKHPVKGKLIIAFTSLTEGLCIDNSATVCSWKLGEIGKGFIPHTNTDTWRPANEARNMKTYKVNK